MNITEYALKFKTTVYVFIVMIILVGLNSYKNLPLEAAPDVQIPIILIHTVYPGVSPEDMERLVTNIVERELKDLDDVKKMTSTSAESSSMVQIEFETSVDMDDAYQKTRDKVDKAKPDLPVDAEEPILIEINISEFPIMVVNISGDYGLEKLKQVGEKLEDEIEQIPGVLEVDLVGGLEREIQVYLNPERMEYYKIGAGQVIGRIQEEHLTTPAGYLELGNSKYSVRIPGEYKNVSQMEDIVVKAPGGKPVKIRDIGRVVDGFEERQTISRVNGTECVTLRIKKRGGENIVEIADAVRELLNEEEPYFPAGTTYMIQQDESETVRNMVSDLENNIITALLLVLIVLLFAMGVRNASFVAIAIPLSMLIAFIVLRLMGVTLNMVVLFGLILALGMLVDNSIVVIENIYRHASETGSIQKSALMATKEVAWPIIASTATTVCVFGPMLFWPGIMGEFMQYLPQTVIIVLIASLFVALVINPVVASSFLKAEKGKSMFGDSGEVTGPILRRYKKVLEASLERPVLVLLLSVGVFITSIVIFAMFNAGIELFPVTTPKKAQVTVSGPQGNRLQVTDKYVKSVEEILKDEDNVENVVSNVGISGGNIGFGGGGGETQNAVIDVEFLDRHERKHSTWDSIESIRNKMKYFVGAEFKVDVQKEGPPTGDPVSIEISGPDFNMLSEYARQVIDIVKVIPGVVDLKDDFEGGKPEVRIEVDREEAKIRKVSTAAISQAVRTAINGTKASVLREGDKEYDITVKFEDKYKQSLNDLLNITVTGGDDVQIPLRDVAKVETAGGFGSIKHIDQKRTILVSGDVSDRSSSEVMLDVQEILPQKIKLPPGYEFHFTGENEEQEKAAAFLSEAFLIGVMLMAMILITQFNSVFRPAIILGSVLMSLIGVFLGLVITQNKFGVIMTGMGVISLAGVVVNNAIVLIDYTNQLIEKHGMKLKEALVKAGVVRFRPVLLTAITTILGLMPMAIGAGIDFTTFTIDTGSETIEWWGPMAQTVIAGLIVATIMTLVIVPVMYMVQMKLTALFFKTDSFE